MGQKQIRPQYSCPFGFVHYFPWDKLEMMNLVPSREYWKAWSEKFLYLRCSNNAILEQLFILHLKGTETYLAAFISHSYIYYMILSGICFVRNNKFQGVFKILSLSFLFLLLLKCRSCTPLPTPISVICGSSKLLTFFFFWYGYWMKQKQVKEFSELAIFLHAN